MPPLEYGGSVRMASTVSVGISEGMVRESPLNGVTLSKLFLFMVLKGLRPNAPVSPGDTNTGGFSADAALIRGAVAGL